MHRIRTFLARPRVLPGLLILYLVVSAGLVSFRGVAQVRDAWDHPLTTDFGPFYAAGGLVLDSPRGDLYGQPYDVPERYARAPRNYFNPPLLALIYSPLTVFGLATAHKVLTAVSAFASLGFIALACFWRPGRITALLAALTTASFWPVYETFRLGNVSVLFALVSGLCLIAIERKRMVAAGLVASLLGLKPSIAVAPLGYLAWLGDRRAIGAAIAGLALFVAAPFFFLGIDALRDYLHLLSAIRRDSFTLRGGVSGGATFMFNWNGFFARLVRGDVSPAVVFPFDLATVALMLKVWIRGDLRTSWLASTLATLLAMPHMLWYDWVLLLPAAFALVLARPSRTLIALLVLLHLCVNLSTLELENSSLLSFAVFVATPAAMVLLVYLAFQERVDSLLSRRLAGTGLLEAPSPAGRCILSRAEGGLG